MVRPSILAAVLAVADSYRVHSYRGIVDDATRHRPAAPGATCAALDDAVNAKCRQHVEWAYKTGRKRPWMKDAYRAVTELAGVELKDTSLEDFQRLWYCGGVGGTEPCGAPPCSCTRPPCDGCYRGTAGSCYGEADTSKRPYRVDWQATGSDFFRDFDFKTHSHTNGATRYLGREEAQGSGVIEAHDTHAIMRVGNLSDQFHRHSAHISTKKRWKHFLAAFRFSHVPFGPGVWPAFWMNGEGHWPDGGEVDILEYANAESGKVSMHTGKSNKCDLHAEEVNKCKRMPDMNEMDYNCYTWYRPEDPLLGCGPTEPGAYRNGEAWSKTPGVVAVEWTEEFVKVFFIPEDKIPGDLLLDQPQPNTWDEWVISFFPFASSEKRQPGSCKKDPLTPQQLIINIELCGDWAGYTFEPDRRLPQFEQWKRKIKNEECTRHHWVSHDDCCSNYLAEPENGDFLREHAYFNISWLKVYKQDDQMQ